MLGTSINALLLAATLALSSVANALPIQQADAFTAGDNKAALETSTGLVWLDFGITNNQTITSTLNQLDSTYAGWRLPTQSEVRNLWNGLFGDLPGWFSDETFGFIENFDLAAEFDVIYDIFNVNGMGEHTTIYSDDETIVWPILGSQGLYKLDNGEIGGAMMYRPTTTPPPGYGAMFYDASGLNALEWKHEFTSTLLVKGAPISQVPEPTSLLLLISGLLALSSRKIRNFYKN